MLKEDSLFLTNQTLSYVEGPDNGPPLVLLHGVLRQWSDFVPIIPALSLRWHVFAIDFRGHGKSSHTPGHYFVADYVRDAASFVSNQLREPAVVYGHSLGAMVALLMAAEMREHIKAVILEDPPFQTMGARIRETSSFQQFAGIKALLRKEIPIGELAAQMAAVDITTPGSDQKRRLGDVRDMAALRWLATCLQHVDPDVFTPILEGRWLEGYDVDRTIQRVRCPTLVLQADGEAGGMLVEEDASFMERSISECVRIRFPGVGHAVRSSAHETWSRVVNNYLESIR
jgi:pimeloyl-ACP methyl ester carboxylesterase